MYISEYCEVRCEENYNVLLVKWKKFCCNQDYRRPLEYALDIIKQHINCNYAADTRTGFENARRILVGLRNTLCLRRQNLAVNICVDCYPIKNTIIGVKMNYNIRKIREDEYTLLNDFIYEAIFIPEGVEPPPKSIINQPDLQVYISNFGKEKDDICFVAEADGKVVGAVWVRDMNDYGHIADGVPSFAIALYKEYRNFGIGTRLMETMLMELKGRGYNRTSLAVQKANYAVRMYKKVGFEIIDENDEEYIMVCELKNI